MSSRAMTDGHRQQLEHQLKQVVAGKPFTELGREFLRNTLRRSVELAKESEEEETKLGRCWELARKRTVLDAIWKAQDNSNGDASEAQVQRIGIHSERLHRNFGGLIATAAAAAAAVRAINCRETDATAPIRMRQWLERAVEGFGGKGQPLELKAAPGDWIQDSPENLIGQACDRLAAAGWRTGTARYWAQFWVRESQGARMT